MSDSLDTQMVEARGNEVKESERSTKTNGWWLLIGIVLWCVAVVCMIGLSWFAHIHRQPLAFELAFSRVLQAMISAPWLGIVFRFLTAINDPLPDAITVVLVVVIFALFHWFRQGIFLALSVVVGNGIDALIGDYVGRPRPTANLVHVDSRLIFNSFPSGHSCHMMVFYGFILFLTFTSSVRQWRYHWLVFIVQFWAVLNILVVGFARLWEGEHWVLDVVGGYLDGLIWMTLFIFLYQIATRHHWRIFHKKSVPSHPS
jgi:membrane-associated phospholipid phosphatase